MLVIKKKLGVYFRTGLKLCISIGCMGLLVSRIDARVAIQSVISVDHLVFLVSTICFVALSALQTWRWLLILRILKVKDVTAKSAQAAVLVGMFFNQGLPSSLGGDVIRIWRLSHDRESFQQVFSSILIERLSAASGMVLMVTLLLPFIAGLVNDARVVWSLGVITLGTLLALILMVAIELIPYSERLKEFPITRFILNITINIRKVAFSFPAIIILLTSVVILVAISMLFWLIAFGLGVQISPIVCIAFIPIVLLITTIPISIAGWGIRETVVVGLFSFVGVSPDQSLAISIVFGLAVAGAALPGGLVWLFTEKPKRSIPVAHEG